MNERMNKQTNERADERMNGCTIEWTNERKKDGGELHI